MHVEDKYRELKSNEDKEEEIVLKYVFSINIRWKSQLLVKQLENQVSTSITQIQREKTWFHE